MNLRLRLTLWIIGILILFAINIAVYFDSSHKRASNLDNLRNAVSQQLKASRIRQTLAEAHQTFLVFFTLRESTSFDLEEEELEKALAVVVQLGRETAALHADDYAESEIIANSEEAIKSLSNLWQTFYLEYNRQSEFDKNLATVETLQYNNAQELLIALEAQQIKRSEAQTLAIKQTTQLNDRATISLFIVTIVVATLFGALLIRHVNFALWKLKIGTVRIGRGDLNHRIPTLGKGELGDLAIAFNTMSERLQTAIEEMHLAKNNADKANRAKSTFLANMSHELRTPLNAIIGYSEMMLEDIEEDTLNTEQQKADIEKIAVSGRQLLSLINNILDFSRIETGSIKLHQEKFDSLDILKEIANTIEPLANQNNNRLIIDLPVTLPTVCNDITKFRHIFYNLLSNACKFTQNGEVLLTARVNNPEDPTAILYQVKDSGIGMSEEQLNKVFSAFVQADASSTRSYGGTGLGLTVCQQYCELMGATLSARSVTEEGSTFTVTLPIAAPSSQKTSETAHQNLPPKTSSDAAKQNDSSQEQRQRATTVLIIDNDEVASSITERTLNKAGYQVVLAQSGKQGIKQAARHEPDIILVDVNLPEIDGWTVLSVLRETPATSTTPIILLSVQKDEQLALELGATAYLQKPIEAQKLKALLEKIDPKRPRENVAVLIKPPSAQRDYLENALKRAEWQVVDCDAPKQALNLIAAEQANLVIFAIDDLNTDNLTLLNNIRQFHSVRQLIVLTDQSSNAEGRKSLKNIADHVFIQTGFDAEKILNAIHDGPKK